MTTKLNAAAFRDTRFELRSVQQGPNSFGVTCAERGVAGNVPPLEVHEDAFTDEEMAQVHAVLEMLERKFEVVHEAWESDPARLKTLLVEAKEAETKLSATRIESQRIELELIAKRAEAEKLDAAIEAKRAAVDLATT